MRAYSDTLPLRLTSAWSRFRAVRAIPHRYGDVAGELVQYDTERRLFVWCDHPAAEITAVLVDGQTVQNWTWYNDADSTGRGVAFVAFDQPVDENVVVTAIGTGKLHARTGDPMRNPGDVLWDILANIAGMDVAESDLDPLRFACSDLEVCGSIIDPEITIQTQAVELCRSFGAIFSSVMPGLARIYPGGDLDTFEAFAIDGRHAIAIRGSRLNIRNAVIVHFDYDDTGPRQSIIVEAPSSIDRYGRTEEPIEAKWTASVRTAMDVATRRLQHRGRPVWTITASGLKSERIKPGSTISIDHAQSPYAGQAMVLGAQLNPESGISSATFEAAVGDQPRVVLVQQSTIIESQQYASVGLQTVGGQRVLTIVGPDGRPLVAARVTLDGQYPVYSDAAGRVFFSAEIMGPGEHVLDVTTSAGLSLQFTVLVQ